MSYANITSHTQSSWRPIQFPHLPSRLHTRPAHISIAHPTLESAQQWLWRRRPWLGIVPGQIASAWGIVDRWINVIVLAGSKIALTRLPERVAHATWGGHQVIISAGYLVAHASSPE